MASSLRRDGTSVTRALTLDDWKKHVANYIRRKKCEPGGSYENTKASEKSRVRSEKVEKRKRLCYEVCEEIPVKRERCAGWAACSTNKPALSLGVINQVSNHTKLMLAAKPWAELLLTQSKRRPWWNLQVVTE
ncbi:hypothetical protein QAD02_010804 [Eretmocerus hayati]|uniref:Uncharacterized protein n=1 Tax=Eretmocerus hayati TaxID=131215 RepID=A0ACC2NVY4_9HYME|nr:hypothetical protein QAD02_010804 [Eretmocerus hayati]